MADAPETPRLIWPTVELRDSFLAGERDACVADGQATEWLERADADFPAYVEKARAVQTRWDVPSSVLWYAAGADYLGTVVIRHRLTPALTEIGGHIGFHVVPRHRRRGHATRMLAAALDVCRTRGLTRVLLTCARDNAASQRVIIANGGVPDEPFGDELRFWIEVAEEAGPFFHGTKADLRVGELLTAGFRSNYRPEVVMNHVYFTAVADGAGLAAELAPGDRAPRVYVVEPTGPFEDDPNVTDRRFPGNPTRSYRSTEPLRIVGEVGDWTRLTPEALRAWRDRLAVMASERAEIIN